MEFDTSSLRRTSDSSDVFPRRAGDVTLIRISASGAISQAQTIGEKREMVETARAGDCLLGAWPGQWRQDIFVIDDREAALRGLDPPRRRS
ncbi:MAG: hypothetical protein ACRDM7_09955 [Thermoleophilaceae bacterium]